MASIATIEITPLMLACQNNNPDDVKVMLSKGAAVDAKDSNNRTALLYCAENIETNCIELLLSYNAQINHQDKDGYSCLHLAVICGNLTVVEYLIKNGADVNITDSEMHSAIHWSVVCGHDEILDFLLTKNADPETADIHGAYPIHYAAQMCGQIDIWDETINRNQSKSLIILKKLIDQKVKIDVEDFDQRNAIIWAASSGSSEALLELFAAGSDPNKHEKDGLTALHCASSRGHLECMKILIEQCKTSVDIMDNNNCTPIFYAATLGQVNACNLLIKYGSNLHVQDCKGRTAYHCAAAKGQLKCLKVLCRTNSNIWLRNRRGDYPIHEAYYNKQMECVYYLLGVIDDKKAARSTNIYDGRTLLHLAAADNDLKLCKRIIADGVDVNCLMKTSSSSYMTPYDIAVLKNSKEVAKYLKSLGGLVGSEVAEKYSDEIKKNFKDIIEHEKNSIKNYENEDDNENDTRKKSKKSSDSNDKNRNKSKKSADKPKEIPKEVEKPKETEKQKPIVSNSKTPRNDPSKNSKNKQNENVSPIYGTEKTLIHKEDRDKIKHEIDENKKKRLQEANTKKQENTKKKIDALSGVYDTKNKKKDSKEVKNDEQVENDEPKFVINEVKDKKKDNLPDDYAETDADADQDLENLEPDVTEGRKKVSKNDERKDVVESKKKVSQNEDEKIEVEKKTKKSKNSSNKETKKNEENEEKQVEKSKTSKEKQKKIIIKTDEKKSSDYEDNDDDGNGENYLPDIKDKQNVNTNRNVKKSNNGNKNQNSKIKKNVLDLINDTSSPERNDSKKEKIKSRQPASDSLVASSKNRSRERSNLNRNRSYSNEDTTVRLIIKADEINSYTLARRNYGNLFDKQRLILKSLYEIRRCRINNRDIIINSELNNLLIKQYDFDIKRNCRSLKELERMLEYIAVEISDEYKKQNKRSHSKNVQNGQWKSFDNINKNEDKKNAKTSEENLKSSRINDTPNNDYLRLKHDRQNIQNDQLKSAYRSLLPNDIYRQYYQSRSNTRIHSNEKQATSKEKTILLPVITQKPSFSI